MSDSSQPHGLQPSRLLHPWDFPGKSTGVGCHHLLGQAPLSITNSWSLLKLMSSGWCHPTISSSVIPFSCLQSFPTSGAFQMSQFLASGGQSIGVSASASVLPVNIQDWFFFRMDWFDLLAIQGTLKSLLQHQSSKGICVCHLSVTSYSPCWDLTMRTEFKQHAKMRIKSQCPI